VCARSRAGDACEEDAGGALSDAAGLTARAAPLSSPRAPTAGAHARGCSGGGSKAAGKGGLDACCYSEAGATEAEAEHALRRALKRAHAERSCELMRSRGYGRRDRAGAPPAACAWLAGRPARQALALRRRRRALRQPAASQQRVAAEVAAAQRETAVVGRGGRADRGAGRSTRLQQQARHDAGGGGVHRAPSAVGAALAGTAAWPSSAADSTLSRGASAAITTRQRHAPQRRLASG